MGGGEKVQPMSKKTTGEVKTPVTRGEIKKMFSIWREKIKNTLSRIKKTTIF